MSYGGRRTTWLLEVGSGFGPSDVYMTANPEMSFFGAHLPFLKSEFATDSVLTPYRNIHSAIDTNKSFGFGSGTDTLYKGWLSFISHKN